MSHRTRQALVVLAVLVAACSSPAPAPLPTPVPRPPTRWTNDAITLMADTDRFRTLEAVHFTVEPEATEIRYGDGATDTGPASTFEHTYTVAGFYTLVVRTSDGRDLAVPIEVTD